MKKFRTLSTLIALSIMAITVSMTKTSKDPVWEYYCIHYLNKSPNQATEKEYNYFLDCFAGSDEYEQLVNNL